MKTTNRFLILALVLSFMGCKEKVGQKMENPKLPVTIYSNSIHVITLYVNTAEIDKVNTGIDKDIDKYANFKQAVGISNKEYTTHVRKGDIVIWRGVSDTDPLVDVVNITSINHHGGPRLFGKNNLKGNKGDTEVVVGVITEGPEMKNGTLLDKENYVLHFNVKKNGAPPVRPFKIDPVLKAY